MWNKQNCNLLQFDGKTTVQDNWLPEQLFIWIGFCWSNMTTWNDHLLIPTASVDVESGLLRFRGPLPDSEWCDERRTRLQHLLPGRRRHRGQGGVRRQRLEGHGTWHHHRKDTRRLSPRGLHTRSRHPPFIIRSFHKLVLSLKFKSSPCRAFLGVLAKTQFVQNVKTQFESAKTQFEC